MHGQPGEDGDDPAATKSASVYSSASAPPAIRARSARPAGPRSHPPVATASAPTATPASGMTHSMALTGPRSSRASPAGDRTKTNGTRKAGSVYLQAISIVRVALAPVMAAAANGDSAVGGDTSDSTA